MPPRCTPRKLLLAALRRRRLRDYRASAELPWVVFPPSDGGLGLQVLYDARLERYRVVSFRAEPEPEAAARLIGEFSNSDDAAECVAAALGSTSG